MAIIEELALRKSLTGQDVLFRAELQDSNGVYYDAFLFFGLEEKHGMIREESLLLCVPQPANEVEREEIKRGFFQTVSEQGITVEEQPRAQASIQMAPIHNDKERERIQIVPGSGFGEEVIKKFFESNKQRFLFF